MAACGARRGGLLAGVLGKASKDGRRATDAIAKRIEQHKPQLEAWEGLCRELGEHPANVALAWILSNEVVTAPIVGPRTVAQLDGAQRALEITMLLAAPLLLAALFIGLLVGVFQAATQINEMTLSFIPKVIGMGATMVIATHDALVIEAADAVAELDHGRRVK